MNLDDIKTLFSYNRWANDKIFEAVSNLSTDQYMQDMKSSHGGIHDTLTHMVGAAKVWLARWNDTPDKKLIQANDVPSFNELRLIYESVESGIESFISGLNEHKLQETLTMTTSKGDVYIHSYSTMLQHLANHSTYHRGQIVTMLRQLGVKPPSTDLIAFFRQKN